MTRSVPCLLAAALLACGDGAAVDTSAEPVAARCDDAPTWEGFAQAFFATHCEGCHGAEGADRMGAPEHATFDTEAEVLALAEKIRAMATGPNPSMPPAGGVPDDERDQLARYLDCR